MKTFLILLAVIPAFLEAAGVSIRAERVEEAPVIDGISDEQVWDDAVPVNARFVQQRPHCGEPMSEETLIRIVYDDHNIYFALEMHDRSPEEFLRMIAPRDHDFASEWLGVWLDTFNDGNNAYFFFVNVDNVQQDGRLSEVGGWDQNWDGVWMSATAVSDSGWSAEIAIPFSILRYSGEGEQAWGINFKRTMTRTNESAYLFRMDDDGSVRIEDFGELHGLEGLPSGSGVELRPYGAGRLQYLNGGKDEWDPWASAGIDARVGLSSQLILDLAVNPDFGQVEADPDQVNLSHWETYLSEKRPFFLEGSDLFSMPFNLFYSRRIGAVAPNGDIIPILGGAKLTGTAGGFRVGLLEAFTGEVDDEGVTLEPSTNYAAGRVVREFGEGTYIGFSGTGVDRSPEGGNGNEYGRAAALDAQLSFLDGHRMNAALAGTWNSSDSLWRDNLAYRGWYGFDNGRLDISCGISRKEEDFDANMMGYTSSTGALETWVDADIYHPFAQSRIFQHWWGGAAGWYDRVPNGPITARGVSFNTGTVFRNRYHVAFDVGYEGSWTDRYEGPEGTEYEGGMNYGFSCSSDYRRPLHGDLWGGSNSYCEGWRRYMGSFVRYRPLPYLSVELDLDWSTTSNARKYNWETGSWELRDTDWRSGELSAGWMFSNDLSLRLTSQLSRFQLQWESGTAGREYSHWLNVLMSWSFRPGSMFYIMAGENAEPDPVTGDPQDPEFTLYTKLTWFLSI